MSDTFASVERAMDVAMAKCLGGAAKVTKEHGEAIRDGAKKSAPAREDGRLRSSITTSTRNQGVTTSSTTGPTIFYGSMVEEGTSRAAPHPYLNPVAEAEAPKWVGDLERLAGELF